MEELWLFCEVCNEENNHEVLKSRTSAKKGFSFYEVGISYHGRNYDQGKKIGIKDAFAALYCILRY